MRNRGTLLLTLLGAVLLVLGLAAAYVRYELAEPERFADRAVEAVRTDEVREAVAEQVAVEMLERGSPDLVASRPLVLTAVEAILETEEFGRVLRRSAVSAHELLVGGDRDVIIELEDARDVLAPAIESVSPEVADEIPRDLSPQIAEIRGSDAAIWSVRAADGASAATIPLLAAALIALVLATTLAADRQRALLAAGGSLTVAAGAGLIALAALRAQVVSHAEEVGVLSDDAARAAAGAAWDAFAVDFQHWLAVVGVAGIALVGGVLLAEARIDRATALQHVTRIMAGGSLAAPVRLLRGLALVALGALVLLRAQPVFAVVVAAVGGTLVLLGLAEAASVGARRRPVTRPRPRVRARRRWVAAGAALVAAAGGAVVLLGGSGTPSTPEEEEIVACNGLEQLCDRRLDQVAFAGTHNSMAAADRPGWFFANQVRPIPRQLEDGIRLLMIDPHYGVVDSRGRVRTDLQAEGTSRNRVARQLGLESVQAAERLAGRLGLVPAEGDRELFLCHTLCELGAERMGATLAEIRGFLERNPAEVVIVFVESSVDPAEVEEAFEDADLDPYLATLRRSRPLPTLREMVASGRRLVVLDQGDGGDAPWYHPGFLLMQDTRIGSLLDSPTACDPGRGTPDSPLLLMNHWIDRFPPALTENSEASGRDVLLGRIRSCEEALGRRPNMIAVDFYEHGSVIPVTGELNRTR